MGVLLFAVAAVAIGALVGRWAVVAPVAGAWTLSVLGLERGWWGNGGGDAWQASRVAGAVLGAAAAAFGVLAHRTFRRSGVSARRPLA